MYIYENSYHAFITVSAYITTCVFILTHFKISLSLVIHDVAVKANINDVFYPGSIMILVEFPFRIPTEKLGVLIQHRFLERFRNLPYESFNNIMEFNDFYLIIASSA